MNGRRKTRKRRRSRKKRGGAPFGDFNVGDAVQLTEVGIEFYQARKDAGGAPFNRAQDATAPSTWRGKILESMAGRRLRRRARAFGWPGSVSVKWPADTQLFSDGFVVYKEMAPMNAVHSPPILL